jgi:hypothetical protein
MRTAALILSVVLLPAAGCLGASAGQRTTPTRAWDAVATQQLPAPARRICLKLRLVASMCPTRVPKGLYTTARRPPGLPGPYADGGWATCRGQASHAVAIGNRACRVQGFYVEAGSPAGIPVNAPLGMPGRRLPPGRRTRPPVYVHLILYATRGSLTSTLPFAWPGTPTHLRNGLERRSLHRTHALDFGQVRWAGHNGHLVLAPPLINGGELGDHLIYRWHSQGIDHIFSVHAWEPLLDAVSTLKLTISSTAPHDAEHQR